MRIKSLILAALCMVTVGVYAQSNYPFNGLDMNMGNLSRLSDAKTRCLLYTSDLPTNSRV